MDRAYRIAFKTLGCKLNQYETFAIREEASDRGYEIVKFNEKADVYIINTCTVTSKADYHSRQNIRKALRLNPDAFIAVCGCYSQVNASDLAKIDGVDLITGNVEKVRLFDLIPHPPEKRESPAVIVGDITAESEIPRFRMSGFGGLTRAFVKIQDGCDYRCSYCKVPDARGPSRSKPAGEIIEEVTHFTEAGFGEIVLTGVHLGCWGRDIGKILTELLGELVEIKPLHRLRLSSIEPVDVTDEMIDFLLAEKKICRHLHLPLQSGHPEILKAMGRPYGPDDYAAIVNRIKEADSGWCIGADVIAGFPGETEDEFRTTCDFVQSVGISYLHAFTFSEREGTLAAEMSGKVPSSEREERNRHFKEISRRKRREFAKSQRGVALELLIENARDSKTQSLIGISDNYLRILLDGPDELKGTFRMGRIDDFLADRELGIGELLKES